MIIQIVQANAFLLVQYSVASLIPLLLVPHIVGVIGLVEYGHLAVLIAWGNYGAGIVQYAFPMTGPKQIAHLTFGESAASVFADIAFAKLFLLLPVLIVATISALFYAPLESSSKIAWILIFALPISAGLNSVWFLQSQGRFLSGCLLAIGSSVLTLSIGFICINSNNHQAINYSVVVSISSAMFISAGSMLLAINSIKTIGYKWKIAGAINALKQGWHLFISQFVSMFYLGSGPIIISFLAGAKAAGAYSVTERVITALVAAMMLTHTAAYPRLASAYINNRAGYWKALRLILASYLSIALIIAVLILSLREQVVSFLYREIGSSHDTLLIWGLAWMLLGVFGATLTGYFTVSGRTREILPLTIKILVLSLLIGVPGVWFFGEAGWMAALVLSQFPVLRAWFSIWRRNYGL